MYQEENVYEKLLKYNAYWLRYNGFKYNGKMSVDRPIVNIGPR